MGMGMRAMARVGGGIAATALAAIFAAPAMAQDLLGQPVPAGLGLQTAQGLLDCIERLKRITFMVFTGTHVADGFSHEDNL